MDLFFTLVEKMNKKKTNDISIYKFSYLLMFLNINRKEPHISAIYL